MKKVIVALILLITFWFFHRYAQINQQYPRNEEAKTPMGEQVELQEGVLISVLEQRIWDGKETEEFYVRNEEQPLYEVRILEVVIELENESSKEKEVYLHELNLESLGFCNAVMNIEVLSSDVTERIVQKLQPNEIRTIEMLYEILLYQFPNSDWEKLDEYDMWLTFSLYPEKKILLLK